MDPHMFDNVGKALLVMVILIALIAGAIGYSFHWLF